MTTKNIQQQGQAWGSTTASIVARIDGIEVYSGPVLTVDEPSPVMPGYNIENTMFGWTVDADFNGTQIMTIAVSGEGPVWVADTLADHQFGQPADALLPMNFVQTIDGQQVPDPLTEVMIDGASLVRNSTYFGQWYWKVMPGQTFQATVNIIPGVNYPVWDPVQSYPINFSVTADSLIYTSLRGPVPPGKDPAARQPSGIPVNYAYWSLQPVTIWQPDTSYAVNDEVIAPTGVSRYTALQAVPAGTPLTDTVFWQAYQY